MEERCVMCGRVIPEGRQVCPVCEEKTKRVTSKQFPRWLMARREEKNFNRHTLADKAGMTNVAIGYYENGKRYPRFDSLELILDALGYHIEFVKND